MMASKRLSNLPNPSPCSSYPSLMDLPSDVRLEIWRYLFVLGGNHEMTYFAEMYDHPMIKVFRKEHIIGILRTSRAIYHEAMPIFYRYNTLCFEFGTHFERFMSDISPKVYEVLGSIHLIIEGRNPAEGFKALLRCEQLRHLHLAIYGGVLDSKKWHERHSTTSPGMSDLLKLRGLTNVRVTRFWDGDDEIDDPSDLKEFEKLCTALKLLKQPKMLQEPRPVLSVMSKPPRVVRKQPKMLQDPRPVLSVVSKPPSVVRKQPKRLPKPSPVLSVMSKPSTVVRKRLTMPRKPPRSLSIMGLLPTAVRKQPERKVKDRKVIYAAVK